jgi:hypothetical protein
MSLFIFVLPGADDSVLIAAMIYSQ